MTNVSSILEVGSGHGYIADLVYCRRPKLTYVGLDISWAMCHLALLCRVCAPLLVGDAVALPFAPRSVDVVLDAATIMHVPSWQGALREEARVARRYLILHSVTVADVPESWPMRKYAYGVPVFEAVLSALIVLPASWKWSGSGVDHRYPSLDYNLRDQIGVVTASETWVCERHDA